MPLHRFRLARPLPGLLLGLVAGTSAAQSPAVLQAEMAPIGVDTSIPNGAITSDCGEGFEDAESLFTAEGGWLRPNTSWEEQTYPDYLVPGKGSRWENKIDLLLTNQEGYIWNAHDGSPYSLVFSGLFAHSLFTPPTGPRTGVISNWLVTPEIEFQPGNTLSFATRKSIYRALVFSELVPDRLEVRLCTGDDCTDVGASHEEVGDFTETLLTINPDLGNEIDDPTGATGYPINNWASFTLDNLPESGRGRIAFRHYVPNAIDFDSLFQPGWMGQMVAIDSVELHNSSHCPFKARALFANDFEPLESNAITQNLDTTTVVTGITPACQLPNGWLRRFRLSEDHGLSGPLAIASVDLGIGYVSSSENVWVRYFSIPAGADFLSDNLTQIGHAAFVVQASEQGTLRNFPATTYLPDAGTHDLVVEVVKPEFGAGFLLGANSAPQLQPGYLRGCDYADPVDIASLGFGEASLLMVVHPSDSGVSLTPEGTH